jgi:hypothetical protein
MRVRCDHGFYRFWETGVGEISDLMRRTGFSFVAEKDYFTFETLEAAPKFSLVGLDLIGIPATKTFEGEAWDVFKENEFVYDFTKDLVVPISTITAKTELYQAGNRYITIDGGLILAGSITKNGKVQNFSASYSSDRLTWLYSEVSYV